MIDLLKKNYLYIIFLKLRVKFFNESKLRSQLLKRAHLLDKLNSEKRLLNYIQQEVEISLNEISKRKIKLDNSIKWSLEVLEESKFGKIKQSNFVEKNKMDSSEFEKIIKSRRSVRKWTNKKVNIDLLYKSIDCAQWAPSSCNRQAWFFLVLDKKNFDFLKNLTNQTFFENANKIIVALVNSENYNSSEYSDMFLDLGAAIQNLLLECHNLGLGTCQFGIKQTEKNKKYFNKLNKKFNLPSTLIPVSFIAIGKYDYKQTAPGRKNVDEISKFV